MCSFLTIEQADDYAERLCRTHNLLGVSDHETLEDGRHSYTFLTGHVAEIFKNDRDIIEMKVYEPE